jgi:poly(beta-D-mannuronate) lyase
VIRFRSSTSNLAHHSRITNITIDNYNSIPETIENEWVGLYGTNNRVDHCTFINKNNARATIVVWYATNVTYPTPSASTFHRIDSNFFNGRSFMGENGGETIRVGTSTTSRTDGYNIIEYNLFEDCTQTEPEIISSKSDFNTYRYNTFRNSTGGITLRHGRYNNVYGNFFLVDNSAVTGAYAIRVIDKGHRIFNNYIENVNGNASGGTSQLRAPINLMNGVTTDTTDVNVSSLYFPADSCFVAFNTIVNARGGGGIVLGGTVSGTPQIHPKGIVLANNVVKMTTGSALYRNPNNTSLTFSSEGNFFQAPAGLGTTASGWQSASLDFGARVNGILSAPALVQDVAVNTAYYSTLLSLFDDVQGQQRSAIYDVGADELNGEGQVLRRPLAANEVGAGNSVLLPVKLTSFTAKPNGKNVLLSWRVSSEINMYAYEIQFSTGVNSFEKIGAVTARNSISSSFYSFTHTTPVAGKLYYKLKMMDKDGSFAYSPVSVVDLSKNVSIQAYL